MKNSLETSSLQMQVMDGRTLRLVDGTLVFPPDPTTERGELKFQVDIPQLLEILPAAYKEKGWFEFAKGLNVELPVLDRPLRIVQVMPDVLKTEGSNREGGTVLAEVKAETFVAFIANLRRHNAS